MPLMTWFLWESDDLPQLHIIFLTSCSCSDQLEDGLVVGLFCIQYIRRLALLFEHHLIPRKHGKWEKSCTSPSFLCFLGQARGSAMHASCSVVGCNYVRPHPLITYVSACPIIYRARPCYWPLTHAHAQTPCAPHRNVVGAWHKLQPFIDRQSKFTAKGWFMFTHTIAWWDGRPMTAALFYSTTTIAILNILKS